MSNKPLLSICIPTYNRAEYLKNCFDSIIRQDCFDDRIEVVISDNCSTDNTQKLCERLAEKHSNIHYFRNEKNVMDMNYPIVLYRATGTLRKLTNDTVLFYPGALEYMLHAAEENLGEKPIIHFNVSGRLPNETIIVNSMEELIDKISFLLTSIQPLTVWDDDCQDLSAFSDNVKSRLGQVPYILKKMQEKHKCVIYDRKIISMQSVDKKNLTYGLYEVFYNRFLDFVKPYVDDHTISIGCYEKLREQLLLNFFAQWVVNSEYNRNKFNFSDENLRALLKEEYKDERYYPKYLLKLNFLCAKQKAKRILRRK